MGFKWRKNAIEGSEEPSVVASGVDVVSSNPEGDLKQFKKLHKWDPFLEVEKLDDVDRVLETGDLEKEAAVEATLLSEDSPYPEVRASVRSSPHRECNSPQCLRYLTRPGSSHRRSGNAHQHYPRLDYRRVDVHHHRGLQHPSGPALLAHYHYVHRCAVGLLPVCNSTLIVYRWSNTII